MKRTIVFVLLTIFLIFLVFSKGIPALVRLATFFGEIKSSKERVEIEDTTPPFPPRLQPLSRATNSAEISLQGFAEPSATVKIFLNEEMEREVVAEKDGRFMAEAVKLTLGKNTLKAKAIDQAGNESQDSKVFLVDFDQTPPELEVTSPENEASFSGEKREIEITGTTEPEGTLKINGHLVILGREGGFAYSLSLSEGENLIKVEAQDPAGNKTEKEIAVTYSP